MKIELVCVLCKKSLAISEISPKDCVRLPNACVQIESPFCKDCANVYMYSNGTMKEEFENVSASNHENHLG